MKRYFLSFFVIVASVGYVLWQYMGGSQTTVIANSAGSSSQSASVQNPSSTPTPSPTPAPKPQAQYKDGTYTSPVADAFYGNIQIEVTIKGGKISDVLFLQSPHDQGTSRQINSQSMPLLKQEAIAAQSASVDIVSGATQSSQAFQQALGAVLSMAQN